jgi:hypothetical protein
MNFIKFQICSGFTFDSEIFIKSSFKNLTNSDKIQDADFFASQEIFTVSSKNSDNSGSQAILNASISLIQYQAFSS